MKNRSKIRGIFLMLLNNIIWGTSGSVIRLIPGVDAISITWARALFGALFVLLWLLLTVRPLSRIVKVKESAKELFILALLFIATVGFMIAGVQYGSISTTFFLLYTSPMFVVVFSKFILSEKIKEKDLIPLLLAAIGLVFIFGESLTQRIRLGDIFGLLAGVSQGLMIVVGRRIGRKTPGYITPFWTYIIGMLILTPFANFNKLLQSNLPLIILFGVLNNGIAGIAFFEGLRHTSAKQAGLISLIDPIENSLLAFLILNEVPTVGSFIGGVLIIISMIVQAVESEGL